MRTTSHHLRRSHVPRTGPRVVNQRGVWWKHTGWYVVPNDSREVMSVLGAIGAYSTGQRFAWRGVSSQDYRLSSSIHRRLGERLDEASIRDAELRLLRDARAWGLGVGETAYVDDLGLLADLQHYGVETRLIDFSNNPMTALWFACQAPQRQGVSRSGLVLALNVTGWKTHLSVGDRLTMGHIDDPHGATLEQALSTGRPFLVEASRPSDRLRAQEGLFVASAVPPNGGLRRAFSPFWSVDVPHDRGDAEELYRSLTTARVPGAPRQIPFVAVVIKAGLKKKLLRYLESSYNRTPRVLFPDYAGFAEFQAHGGRGGEPGAVPARS